MSHQDLRQVLDISELGHRDTLPNSVSGARHSAAGRAWDGGEASLYSLDGERKYLNRAERQRVLAGLKRMPRDRALFAQMLTWSGARLSEVLALTPASFDLESAVVTIITLKRRKHHVRQVPIPPNVMAAISKFFGLRELQRDPRKSGHRLWTFGRVTAWRFIKKVMTTAAITGRKACPRGLRHAFGVGSLQAGVPITLVQRWMGHARLSTTSIYLDVCGPEEIAFAELFWRGLLAPRLVRQSSHGLVRQFL